MSRLSKIIKVGLGEEGKNRKQADVPHTMLDPTDTSLSRVVPLA